MNIFSEIIKHFEGQTVRTHIIHKIYGDHKITVRNFCPLCVENKIGFVINDHEIFVHYDQIEAFEHNGNVFIVNDALQKMVLEIV